MVDGPVLIVGCGVFGLSTALALIRDGHYVHIIDRYEPPSPWSAANDFNKIIRCEYDNPVYLDMAIEALHLWRSDPLFSKSYNECGRILVTPLSHKGRIEFEMKSIKMLQSKGEGKKFEISRGGSVIADQFPVLAHNRIPHSQEVKFNPESGLGYSGQTLSDVYQHLASHPKVRFTFGEAGYAVGVKKYTDGQVGVITQSGFEHSASHVLLSMGANTGNILNLNNQQSATGLLVTHIQLTDSEFSKYQNMPILFDAEMGYFFPPDAETKIMKVCLSGTRLTRIVSDPFDSTKKASLPRFHNEYPQDTIPKNCVPAFRSLLQKYILELATHKFFGSKICWIGDREGSNFLIDKVPDFNNLYVATGDSGHAYKFFPNIGKYIIELMDGSLEKDVSSLWEWKSRKDSDIVDSSAVSWRVTKTGSVDIEDIEFLKETYTSKL